MRETILKQQSAVQSNEMEIVEPSPPVGNAAFELPASRPLTADPHGKGVNKAGVLATNVDNDSTTDQAF